MLSRPVVHPRLRRSAGGPPSPRKGCRKRDQMHAESLSEEAEALCQFIQQKLQNWQRLGEARRRRCWRCVGLLRREAGGDGATRGQRPLRRPAARLLRLRRARAEHLVARRCRWIESGARQAGGGGGQAGGGRRAGPLGVRRGRRRSGLGGRSRRPARRACSSARRRHRSVRRAALGPRPVRGRGRLRARARLVPRLRAAWALLRHRPAAVRCAPR